MSHDSYTFQVTVRGALAGVVAQAIRRVVLTIAVNDTDARECHVVATEPIRTVAASRR